jgi:excisionase family DNA binding protein
MSANADDAAAVDEFFAEIRGELAIWRSEIDMLLKGGWDQEEDKPDPPISDTEQRRRLENLRANLATFEMALMADAHLQAVPVALYVNVPKAADMLGYGQQHVRRLAEDGKLPGAKKFGRDYLIPLAALQGYVHPKPRGRPRRGTRTD